MRAISGHRSIVTLVCPALHPQSLSAEELDAIKEEVVSEVVSAISGEVCGALGLTPGGP